MIFSPKYPKKPGRYWMRYPGDGKIVPVKVESTSEGLVVYHGTVPRLLDKAFSQAGFLFGDEIITPTLEVDIGELESHLEELKYQAMELIQPLLSDPQYECFELQRVQSGIRVIEALCSQNS